MRTLKVRWFMLPLAVAFLPSLILASPSGLATTEAVTTALPADGGSSVGNGEGAPALPFYTHTPGCQAALRATFEMWDYIDRGTTPIPEDDVFAGVVAVADGCDGLESFPSWHGLPFFPATPEMTESSSMLMDFDVEGAALAASQADFWTAVDTLATCPGETRECMFFVYFGLNCKEGALVTAEHVVKLDQWITRLAPYR